VGEEIRRVGRGDEAALRELRLRALSDAPAAFASSAEVESAHPESYWSELAEGAAIFVAVVGARWVAMAGGRWFDPDHGVVQLWGMWVDPAERRSGVGARLVDAVDRWGREQGARSLRLGVIEGVDAAPAFYRRLGFEPTGETRALTVDPSRTACFLARPVLRGQLGTAVSRPRPSPGVPPA
jgi:GNAT superfamily N-acetyltransferase